MKTRQTLRFKIVMTICLAFVAVACALLWLSANHIKKVVSHELDAGYQREISLYHGFLTQQYQKLSESGLSTLYGNGFQNAQVETIERLAGQSSGRGYPLIFTMEGKILLHNKLPKGHDLATQSKLLGAINAQSEGIIVDTLGGEKTWISYKRFEPWQWVMAFTITEHDKYAQIDALIEYIILILIVSCVLFLTFISGLLNRMLAPLNQLLVATESFAKGNFKEKVDVKVEDEIGEVSKGFNGMADTLRKTFDELKQREYDLQIALQIASAASKSKTQFLANMSHELRTPIAGITVAAESLKLEIARYPDKSEEINSVLTSSDLLLRIVSDILDYTRLDNGDDLDINSELCELPAFLESNLELRQSEAFRKNLDFKLFIHYPIPTYIQTDRSRLQQILSHLFQNAIKFTDEGGVAVTVAFDTRDSVLNISVKDSGIGMSSNQLKHAFQPFNQADMSDTRRYGGTGIGLAICKQLASLLNGEISATSTKPGGSTFTLSLSIDNWEEKDLIYEGLEYLLKPMEEAPDANNGSVSENVSLVKANILLVEDTPTLQLLYSKMLRKLGQQVTLASNGQEALEWTKKQGFDLILMDIQMPVMDGITATKHLRENHFDKPIVALTANATPENRANCSAAGCSGFVNKPISYKGMQLLLSEHLDTPLPASKRG